MATYDASTALVVVDVQNDFADPKGSLYVHEGDQTAVRINAEIARARGAGAPILYTQDWHPPRTPHFVTDGGIWPVHCVQDTWGAELHPTLDVAGEVVRKGSHGEDGYSGFTMRDPITGETRPTELQALLERHDTRRLVVVGLATDYCVKATALDGRSLGYPTTVLTDAVRAVNLQPGDGEAALAELAGAGVTLEGASAKAAMTGGEGAGEPRQSGA
jgi:nicotinamidase/pyrazinamidase